MKHYLSNLTIFLSILVLSIACNKDSDDNSFYIEAVINGTKWRGESPGNYLASAGDGSKMKIYLSRTEPAITGYNFPSNDDLPSSSSTNPDFVMPHFVIGAFGSKVQLKWETTMESNIDRFEIERSTTPGSFQTIGFTPGSGTSSTLKAYAFTDNNLALDLLTTTINYRIKAITTGGTVRYTDIKPLVFQDAGAQIAYQTNNGKLYFALDNSQNQVSVTSFDPNTSERRGTFSFNYKDETGNIVQVRNGKFHLRL